MWIDRWIGARAGHGPGAPDSGANWLEDTHGTCGQGVRGEVLDSGVQQNHPDFDGIMMHGSFNSDSHGTSTFGIVFGNGDRDGDGNAQGTGHMPSSTGCASQGIFADFDFLGDRFAHTQQLKQAPYFASFQTNSWGGGLTTQYTSISSQMDDIIWRLDIAITQSQSNAGTQLSRPQAWAKNIISVGGIRHFNTLSTRRRLLDERRLHRARRGRAHQAGRQLLVRQHLHHHHRQRLHHRVRRAPPPPRRRPRACWD